MAAPWEIAKPQPTTFAPWETGPASAPVSAAYDDVIKRLESSGNVGAVNPNTKAAGYFQFTPATAAQYGLTQADLVNPDPLVQAKVKGGFDKFTSDNAAVLQKGLGRAPTQTEIALAQFGAGNAMKLLSNRNAKAADLVGLPMVIQNGGSPNMTASDFVKLHADRFSKAATALMPFSAVKGISAVLPDQQRGPQIQQRGASRTRAPDEVANWLNNFLVGAAHGGVDVPLNSIAQGGAWLTDKANDLLGTSPQASVSDVIAGTKPQSQYDKTVAEVNKYNDLYNLTNAGNSFAGTAGNIAGGVAGAMLTPGAGLLKGATILPRVGRGILGGATYGAEQNSATGNSLLGDVGLNAFIGGGVGAASPLVTKPLAWATSKLFGNGAEAATGAAKIEPSLTGDIIPPSRPMPRGGPVSAPAGISLRPGVNGELSIPSPSPDMNPAQLNALAKQRVANFESLGLTGESGPTQAMATRDPLAWTKEQNDAAQDIGRPLVARFQNINAGLQRNVNQLQAGTGGNPAVRPYGVGQQVIEFVQGKSKEMGKAVSDLYTGVRNAVGGNMGMKPNALFGAMNNASSIAAADPLVASVQRELGRLGIADPMGRWSANPGVTTKTVLSVDDAEELRKFIGELDAGNKSVARVKGRLIAALDKDVLNSAGTDNFAQAREAAHARFSEFERNTMDAIESGKMEPDDVMKKFVYGGKVADLNALKTSLLSGTPEQVTKGTAIWNNIRYQVLDHLHDAAFGKGLFSPAGFNKAIDQLGPERLEALFTPQELDHIARIQQAGSDAFSDVPLSAVNHSHSGPMLADHTRNIMGTAATVLKGVNKASNVAGAFGIPTPHRILTDPLEKAAERAGAARGAGAMLTPNLPDPAAVMRSAAARRIAALLGQLPLPNTAAAINQSRQ